MGKVIFASWFEDASMMRSSKVNYFLEKGIEVDHIFGQKKEEEWLDIFSKYDHIFCYNGFRRESISLKLAIEKSGIPTTYHEGGILPARVNQFVDRKGILAGSSFCENIDWVNQRHFDELEEWKQWYKNEIKLKDTVWKNGDYIFCPMQCWWDANLYGPNEWSPFTDKNAMKEFMINMQNNYPNDRIMFRCHPQDHKEFDIYKKLIRKGNQIDQGYWANDVKEHDNELMNLMLNSKKVIGVNSTCLLQSILFGIPTEALGKGYVKSAGTNKEDQLRMVAAVRGRTFHWEKEEERCFRIMDEVHEPGEVFWK